MPTTVWAVISGTLSGPTNGSTFVQAFASDSACVGDARAGEDGSFALDVFSARPVKLYAGDFYVGRWYGGDSFETALVVDPLPGAVTDGIEIAFGGVRCVLTGPEGIFDPKACAVLRDESGRDFTIHYWRPSPLVFCNLRPARYRLYVYGIDDDQPWGSQWYDGASRYADATPIEVVAGRMTELTVRLLPGAALEGRISYAGGGPLANSAIVLSDADGALSSRLWSEKDGSFRYQGLGDGRYRLAASVSGGSWWYPGTFCPDSAAEIEVIDHQDVTGIEWSAP